MRPRKGGSDFAIRTLTLAPARVAAIRAYAHARGATVNGALIAALIRSSAAMFPQKDATKPGVSISADTRRFARGADLDRLSNIATTQTVLMDYRDADTFDETLQHVVDGIKPYKDCLWTIKATQTGTIPPPMLTRAIFGSMVAMMRASQAAALITMNIGPFDEERLSFG
jgi:NRPS condensation-like uncharacterized protein